MAINDNENQQQQNTNAPAQSAPAPSYNQRRSVGNFTSILSGLANNYVVQGAGGEYFIKMRDAMALCAKNLVQDGLTVKFYSLNRQEHQNLRFSALVLALSIDELPNHVAYHTLVLEGTGDRPKPEMVQIDNRQVAINKVTSDAVDSILMDLIHNVVIRNNENKICLSAASQVVNSTISSEPKDASITENIIRNAAMACVSQILQETDKFEMLSLFDFPRDSRMVIDVVVGNNSVYDDVGSPQRASAQLSMSIVNNNQRRALRDQLDTLNNEDGTIRICDVAGFLNPVWAPMQDTQLLYRQPGQQIQVPKLAAEFVITGVRTPYATSPAAVLMAISTAYALMDDNKWMQLLLPTGVQKQDKGDLTDIGSLNIVCDTLNQNINNMFGSPVDVSTMAGDLVKISQYIARMFKDGMLLSIDCPESGPQSWYLNVFVAAAMGDLNATNTIVKAADELTGGHFSSYYKGGNLFCSNIRVPLGYYMSGNVKRDIRDIDLTAICKLFASNPEQIHEYNSTFVPRMNHSEPTLLAQREGFIKHALRDQCDITGYAQRLTFSNEFLGPFSQATAAAQLNTVVNTPLTVDQLRHGTPTPDYVNNALMKGTRTFSNNGGFASGPRHGFGNQAAFGIRR